MNKLIVGAIVLSLVGCAATGANYAPLIDTRDVDMNKYHSDLAECQAYAAERMTAAQGAGAGAVGGAILGGLLMVAITGNSDALNQGMAAGAGGGAMGAGTAAEANQRQIIKTCLQGRGYKVLE